MKNKEEKGNEKVAEPLEKDQKLLDYIYDLKQTRENFEPMAYMSRKAYEGKHFIYWNRTQQQLEEMPIKKTFFNQYPEVAKQVDSFENFLLSQEFVFTVVPKFLSDEGAVRDSMMLSLLAKQYYDKFKESTVFPNLIHFALLDNVSFIEVTPDDTNKDVTYRHFDFFDILFDAKKKEWADVNCVVKVVKKKKTDILESKLYKTPVNWSPDSGGFFSWKDIYQNERYASFGTLDADEAIIFECYMLDQKTGLTIRTIDGSYNVIRNDNYPKIHKMPIIPLRIYSGEWWQDSYAFRQIPMNRSADLVGNRMEDFILRLAKGGWLMQGEEDINGAMNEEMGQIVRYDTTKPEPITIQNVPNWIFELQNMSIQMADRYGIGSIQAGQMPNKASGIRSNKMLETMKALAAQNNTASINNYKNTIKQLLEVTFMFLYEMWNTPQEVISTDMFSKAPKFVSDKHKEAYSGQNVVTIPSDFRKFSVELDNALGYTLDTRKENAVELRKMNIISDSTLKKIFCLGSTSYLMESEATQMYETEDFQKLVKSFKFLKPDEQAAVMKVLQILSSQKGNQQVPDISSMLPQGATSQAQAGKPPQPAPQEDVNIAPPQQPAPLAGAPSQGGAPAGGGGV